MSDNSVLDNCFTYSYLRQYESIESTTIETLISNGFRDKNSLLRLDLDQISSEFHSIDLNQREILMVAIKRLHTKRQTREDTIEEETMELKNKRKKLKSNENKENMVFDMPECLDQKLCIRPSNDIKPQPLEPKVFKQLIDGKSAKQEEMKRVANISTSDITTDYSFEDKLNQSLVWADRLVPTLEAFIFIGRFHNLIRKSKIIREFSKYCLKSYSPMDMWIKNESTYDLVTNKNLFDLLLINCPNLKCLRLSYCKVNVSLLKSLKSLDQLRCLHMEYIFGIDSAEEWTQIGESLKYRLQNLAFNADSMSYDINGMVSELDFLRQLTLEEYNNDYIKLFSSIQPNLIRLSLNNYYDIDLKAIEVLASRVSQSMMELEVVYNSYHPNRANAEALFAAICKFIPKLRKFRFKLISMSNMKPLYSLKNLNELDLQFSALNFMDIPTLYAMKSVRILSLTKILFTPQRVSALCKTFPQLRSLSLTGNIGRDHNDSPLFCCECRKKDKREDDCLICYENCCKFLTKLSFLKVLKLNYVRIRSSFAIIFPSIPKLERLVINPFVCYCGEGLLMSAIKFAESRVFILEIRKCFISETLKDQKLPKLLEIIEYNNKSNDK